MLGKILSRECNDRTSTVMLSALIIHVGVLSYLINVTGQGVSETLMSRIEVCMCKCKCGKSAKELMHEYGERWF